MKKYLFLLFLLFPLFPSWAWAVTCEYGVIPLETTCYFNLTNMSGGALAAPSAGPTYYVYEDNTTTELLTGSMSNFDSKTGLYQQGLAITAANGFETGKSYNVFIQVTNSSQDQGTSFSFQVGPMPVNAIEVSGDSTAADNLEASLDGTGFCVGGTTITLADITPGTCTDSPIPANCWILETTSESFIAVDGEHEGQEICVGTGSGRECREIASTDDAAGNDLIKINVQPHGPFSASPDNESACVK